MIATGPGWELRCGSCLDLETGLASVDAIDHIIADPQYGEHSHTKQRRVDKTGRHEIDPLPFPPMDLATMAGVALQAHRMCSGWFVAFCEFEDFGKWKDALRYGRCTWRRAGIWLRPPTPQITGDRPGQAGEGLAIAWCGKSRSVWNGRGKAGLWKCGNVWRAEGLSRADALHPSQKPVELMEMLLRDFTQPGELICDPFAGSGTTGVACIRLGRRFLGFERDPGFFETARKRLEGTREQRQLFDARPEGKQDRWKGEGW